MTHASVLHDRALWRWGAAVLWLGLGLGLASLLGLLMLAPSHVWLVGGALSGGVAVWWLFRHPLANLFCVLAFVAITSDYEPGIQAREALHLLYHTAFLAGWFLPRLIVREERARLLQEPEDKALFLFLLVVLCSPVLTVLNGGSLGDAGGELFALSMLALFFPIREVCVRYRIGPYVVWGALILAAIYVGTRNLINYQEILARATQAWQVTKGRSASNDTLLLAGTCFSLVPLLYARRLRAVVALGGTFVFCFLGLIITQSRGYWIAFLLGCGLLLWLLDWKQKGRFVGAGLVAVTLVTALAMLLLGDLVQIVVAGLVGRFASTASAASSDPSLIGRFHEAMAVWDRVVKSPVLGYGPGVQYHFYDLVQSSTRVDTFLHNGYLALWYKYGAIGLALMMVFLLRALYLSCRTALQKGVPISLRLGAMAGAMSLLAMLVAANTSNPFHLNDMTFTLAVITGLGTAGAAWVRHPDRRLG